MQKLYLSLLLMALWVQAVLAGPMPAKDQQAPESQTVPCKWAQAAELIQQGEHELHQTWRFDDSPVFWSTTLPQSASLETYRQQVQAMFTDLEPRRYYQAHPLTADSEAYNKTLAVSDRAGQLQPISCLEALLLSEQTQRLPMLKQPSEFGAFILRQASDGGAYHYKVYFSTQDQPGLRMNAQVMELIDADQQAGWTVWAHLHNHNVFPDKADPFASPSPSKTDVEFARMMYKGLNLENLWVTNGFHTLHLSRREFYLYHGHSDEASDDKQSP